jgi:NADH-quinone oxidoreductase subunit N
LLFKIGAVPFHTWSPDAYTGATIGVTGFMGAVMKVGAVLGLLAVWLNAIAIHGGLGIDLPLSIGTDLIISDADREGLGYLPVIILTLAVLSLLLGTFSALGQTSLRRLMAYSGIAHAGYLLMAFVLPQASVADQSFSLWTVWYYLIAYAIGSAGVMLAAAVLAADNDGDALEQLAGSASRFPLAGVAFTIFVASLAGLPPTAGFLGKFLVLADLVAKGEYALAFIAMLLAAVAVVFYLRLIIVVWSSNKEQAPTATALPMSRLVSFALIIAVVATFALMFVPTLVGGQAA